MDKALRSHLAGHAGLTGLVSSRISPEPLPQGETLPAVTYRVMHAERSEAMDGTRSSVAARVTLRSWAPTPLEALIVADQVRAALATFRGAMAGTLIEAAFIEDERTDYAPETQRHQRVFQLLVWYEE